MNRCTPERTESAADARSAGTRMPSTQPETGAAQRPVWPGDSVGRYTIRSLIGAGGMGQVFAAYDPQLGRTVALKLIGPRRLGASQARARFLREAQALARLSHPNVVTVFDAGRQENQVFVAMELIEGKTLGTWLHERPRTWREVREVFLAAGRGLEAAHAAGLVHRDFKPQNVIVAAGRVVVLDFGLARAEGDDEPLDVSTPSSDALSVSVTLTGELLGTPRYMAPEQLAGRPATARSDQFSFCVALFEALYGRPPFAGMSIGELARATASGAVAVPGAKVPRFLATAVGRGLRTDPERRHPTMPALLAELARDPGRTARRGLLAGAAIVALLVTGATGAWRSGIAPRPSCAAATAALDERWQPARRRALADGFAALPGSVDAWGRAEPALDRWVARWRTQSLDVCASASAVPTPSPLMVARRACLERRLAELDSLLAALAAPDATVAQYAGAAAHALAPPETCLGALPTSAESAPPAARDALAHGRARLDAAATLRRVGKPRPGLAEAQAAAEEAESIGWPPFTAEAKLELGAAQLAVGATDAAGEAYAAALLGAEQAGDDALRFDAMMGVSRVALEASSFVEAQRALQTASAIGGRLPGDPDRGARLALAGARLAAVRGQLHQCVVRGDEAVALAEQSAGPEAPAVASALMTTGECHGSLGEPELARAQRARALAITEKVSGHEQQQTADLLSDLAALERRSGQLDAALRDAREVLAIRERVVGPESPDCAAARDDLANVLRELGRHDEARREVDRALAIWTQAWSADSPAIAVGLGTRGAIAMAEGRPAAAEADLRRALEIGRAKRGAGHPETVRTLEHLADALLAQRKREAVALLAEAVAAVMHDPDAGPAARARSQFLLGRRRPSSGSSARPA